MYRTIVTMGLAFLLAIGVRAQAQVEVKELSEEVQAEQLLAHITHPYRGKKVLIDCWNTWCGPCMRAMQSIHPLKEELTEVVYLYVADTSSPELLWRKSIEKIPGVHYRISARQSYDFFLLQGFQGIPAYIVVNEEGDVTYRCVGFPGVKTLRRELTKEE